jgi:MFS family permease
MLAIPCMMLYLTFGSFGLFSNILWLFIVGLFVNGPYTLVSSAVAADLGSHPTLNGNPLAMSTVTGIIDGCGSVGAALEGILVGYIGNHLGWDFVFYALMVMSLFCALTLVRIIRHELCGDGSEYGEHKQMNFSSKTKKLAPREEYEYVRVEGDTTSRRNIQSIRMDSERKSLLSDQ